MADQAQAPAKSGIRSIDPEERGRALGALFPAEQSLLVTVDHAGAITCVTGGAQITPALFAATARALHSMGQALGMDFALTFPARKAATPSGILLPGMLR